MTFPRKLDGAIQKRLQGIAARLSEQESKLSINKKKMVLILFCAAYGSVSLYLTLHQLTGKTVSGAFSVKAMEVPFHIGKNLQREQARIGEDDYNRVEGFRRQLDSLKSGNPGRYSEILSTRPHLMDSIDAFEKLYLTQSKK